MNLLENDLEEIIFKTPPSKLRERDLPVWGKCKRQLRIGNYGVCDLLYYSRCPEKKRLIVQILELKKETVSVSSFIQGIRYCKGVKRYLHERGVYDFELNLILIAPNVNRGDFIYLPSVLTSCDFSLEIYQMNINIDGIYFEDMNDYKLIDEGF